MKEQSMLDNEVQSYYETLPELLGDLSNTITNFIKSHDERYWYASIDCSGDYHNFIFSNTRLHSLKCNTLLKSTYENLESLNTELEYIREFLSTQDIGEYDLSYEIASNGNKPLLRVHLHGKPIWKPIIPELPDESPSQIDEFYRFFPYREEVGRCMLYFSVIPFAIVSGLYAANKLGIYKN